MKNLVPTCLAAACACLAGCSHTSTFTQTLPMQATVRGAPMASEEDASSGSTGLTAEDLINEPIDQAEKPPGRIPDPFKPVNRAIHGFNDGFYGYVLRPASRGYDALVPDPVERGVANVFSNLRFPQRFASNVLQAKFDAASKETRKFVLNSTAGVLGLWRISDRVPSLNTSPEDFGQTLGAWGIPHGAYVVLPFIGPSSIRDFVGDVAGGYAYPPNYLEPVELALGARGVQILNDAEPVLDDYEALKFGAIDFYESLKDGYVQNRNRLTSE